MATLSISLLKHQKRKNGTYPVSISVSHSGQTAYINTGLSAGEHQVQIVRGKLKLKDKHLLREVLNLISDYEKQLPYIYATDAKETAKKLQEWRQRQTARPYLIDFVEFGKTYISRLKSQGKRDYINFQTLINTLRDYTGREMIFTSEINLKFLINYKLYLQSPRTIVRGEQEIKQEPMKNGVYNKLKDFRTLFYACQREYNNEDEGTVLIPHNPFKDLKNPQPPTNPRGITMREVCSLLEQTTYGTDMFFISFFLCGMNLKDLYYLTDSNYKNGRITYNRRKTKDRRKDSALISIKVEPVAWYFIEKYKGQGRFLEIKYRTYEGFLREVNSTLPPGLTSYIARHSWATIARNECEVSKDDIHLALNHASADITDTYLKTDWSIIDRANRKVIELFSKLLSPPQRASLPHPLITNED